MFNCAVGSSAVTNLCAAHVRQRLEQLLWEQVGAYVDEQLEEHFADLVASVRAAEDVLTAEPAPENPSEVLDLVQLERAVGHAPRITCCITSLFCLSLALDNSSWVASQMRMM